jgi:hypothetical protein
MAGSFGRFHSMRLLSQQRLDVLDKGTFSALVAARLSALCRTESSKRAVAQDGNPGGLSASTDHKRWLLFVASHWLAGWEYPAPGFRSSAELESRT